MKINHQKLIAAYTNKINQICENCENKSHFNIPEIVSIIAGLIESGEFYDFPLDRGVLEIGEKLNKLYPEWSAETKDFIDELYSRLEWAETENTVFKLRLKKQWTPNSGLYTKQELDELLSVEYNIGYENGYDEAIQ